MMPIVEVKEVNHDDTDRPLDDDEFVEDTGSEEPKAKHPLIELAEKRWLLQRPDSLVPQQRKSALRDELNAALQKDSMLPYYNYLNGILPGLFTADTTTLDSWKQTNEQKLTDLNTKLEEAKETGGDTEYRDALLQKANYYSIIGDKEESIKLFEETYGKTIGASSQIDVGMALLRLAYAFDDLRLQKKYITRLKELIEKGGDWERKNLLQVYEAVYCLHTREFPQAAKLLLNSIATFTCYELISYQQFILYTIVSAVIATDRQTLKKHVLNAPEILQSIDDIPHLRQFMTSLYDGRYADYFVAVEGLEHTIATDSHLSTHLNWIIREIRIVAYQQFLLSYRSVTLQSMAATFGVSADFLDKELFRFIGSGRLSAKIDRVSGVVETVKADTKNRLYADMIQHGDALLNRVQKLTRVFAY